MGSYNAHELTCKNAMFGNYPSCFADQIKRLNGTIGIRILLNKCIFTLKNPNTSFSYEAKHPKTPNVNATIAIGSTTTTIDVSIL
jgi:hypothetical protein